MTLVMIILLLTMTVTMINHPMLMVASIILQTISLSFMMSIFLKTSWYSYVLFLVFLGGMMVLFVYICSLASNEMFKIKVEMKTIVMFLMFLMLMYWIFYPQTFMSEPTAVLTLNKMFSYPTVLPTITSMFYLLLTLIVAVKITHLKMGPVRTYKM